MSYQFNFAQKTLPLYLILILNLKKNHKSIFLYVSFTLNLIIFFNFRYLTVQRENTAKKAIWLSGIAITVILSIVAYAGLVIYAHYMNCDPIKSGLVSTKDQLLPLFVMDLMSDLPGFPGFFVAGVFSGALSTVSGGLNSLAAVTLEDNESSEFAARATYALKALEMWISILNP